MRTKANETAVGANVSELFERLANGANDPLHDAWLYARDLMHERGLEKGALFVLYMLTVQQEGSLAKTLSVRSEDCPYKPPLGDIKLEARDFLADAWMAGYMRVENERVRRKSEDVLKDAYDELGVARNLGESMLTNLKNVNSSDPRPKLVAVERDLTRCLDTVRNVWASLLTPSLKHRLKLEREQNNKLLGLEDV